ncbi:hybrid sensor histidine kinase/response regulator [Pseudoxanthomonas composti]|uniref:histidine kinase n=1 Tax=Pseudoxanthomonas composti TaxID=2137479 RepID=A0A4Q1JYD5_9GAMM|nr:response regulator [Pseudoxanthomonas composti]RXR07380.1 response regulator [Pseudoxanthomonas composti]
MQDPILSRDRWVLLAAGALMAATMALELVVPLGYAIWLTYFFAVGITVFQSHIRAPLVVALLSCVLLAVGYELAPASHGSGFSHINRSIGGVSFLAMAMVVTQALRARQAAEAALWLQEAENAVALSLRGEQEVETLANAALGALCEQMRCQVGALYRLEESNLVLVGGVAVPAGIAGTFPVGQGQLGEVVRGNRVLRLRDVEAGHLSIETGLGRSAPRELFIAPVTADGRVMGALELARTQLHAPAPRELALLEQCAETIGLALRASLQRRRLIELLEETQRQSEELQAQQEELRVANEELEEQSRSLQHSQASLEQQQADLEQTNVVLEERTHELEAQKQALLAAQAQLMRSAEELATTSRYKSEFLANMSHELRTPLNSSLILAKLLVDNKDGNLSQEQVKYAQAILSSNNDLLALINDILDLSRIEAGHVELAEEPTLLDGVAQRMKDTFEPMAQQKGLQLAIEIGHGAPERIEVDSQRLQQILKNLLANAIKFTERGSVSLKIQAGAPGRVRFEVCDTGIGIPRDQLAAIFEAFRQADGSTRRKYGGTGLGLSISRDLASHMGGGITVDSEPGRGSCFILDLPAAGAGASASNQAPPAPQAAPMASAVSQVLGSSATPSLARSVAESPQAAATPGADALVRRFPGRLILAIEDDARFAQALAELANELQFDCVVAPSAEEGLALAAKIQPDGILLDIGLPDVSGLSVLERIKRDPSTRHIPVHIVSALERAQVSLELGAVGFLLKPATRERLAEAIQQLEETNARAVRRLLIVEDDQDLRANLQLLLARDQLEIVPVGTVAEAMTQLGQASFDCMITDLALPDGTGYDLLERMAESPSLAFPPVIVYTGRALSREEEQRLRRYSKSIIIKGARSPERLLDEVTLFLHSVESQLPSSQQRLLKEARRRDAVLDGRTILLAEDDVRNIFALSSVLEPLGVKLEIARNGREALERLQTLDPDLVLMDIMMPEMDGLTAMRHIRAAPNTRDLPIIALTAKAMADDRERCLQAGANDYIAKPIDVDKLVSLCRVWCSRQ